jgi:hypothetical protein
VNTPSIFACLSFMKRRAWSWSKLAWLPGLAVLLAACATPFSSTASPLSGRITVDGSTALQPLVSKAETLFEKTYPQVHIEVGGGGNLTGLNDVTTHKVDIGDSDIYADPAIYPDPNLTDHLVCVIPFTMIVSSDVNVTKAQYQEFVRQAGAFAVEMNALARRLAVIIQEMRTGVAAFHFEGGGSEPGKVTSLQAEPELFAASPSGPIGW